MPKVQALYTGAKSNLRNRVWGEIEKKSFIALPRKVGYRGSFPQNLCVSTQEDLMRHFRALVQGWGAFLMVQMIKNLPEMQEILV